MVTWFYAYLVLSVVIWRQRHFAGAWDKVLRWLTSVCCQFFVGRPVNKALRHIPGNESNQAK
jgi:hypothetical protein